MSQKKQSAIPLPASPERAWRAHALPLLVLFGLVLLISLTTLFGPFYRGDYGYDAGIFASVGLAMRNGRVLYTEVWENKGPLLYVIQLAGISVHYWHGIYLLELLSLCVTAFFAYRTALLVTKGSRWVSAMAAGFPLLLLAFTLEHGNLSEEYALPFICAALYFTAKFFFQQYRLKAPEVIVVGMCFAAVFLLRANICAFFLAMIAVGAVLLIRDKKWNILLRTAGLALAGVVLFVLPFAVYLIANNAWRECLFTAYLNIMGDFARPGAVQIFKAAASMVFRSVPSGAPFLALVFLIRFALGLKRKSFKDSGLKAMLWICAVGLPLNFAASGLMGFDQMHYFMPFVPILIIPAAWLLHTLHGLLRRSLKKEAPTVLVLCAVVLFGSMGGLHRISLDAMSNLQSALHPKPDLAVEFVWANTEPNDCIQVFGGLGGSSLHYRSQRLSASKHLYFWGDGNFTAEKAKENANIIAADCYANPPKLILFGEGQMERFFALLEDEPAFGRFLREEYALREDAELTHAVYERI
ncbi:MAG: hypothetical protein FWH26_05520 [Oscillospiraceae bacterium]|nr:hypothetical protein [Oscillospiraceae bacterium]